MQADPMETAKTFFNHTALSTTGDMHSVCLRHSLHQEEETTQHQSPASNIDQPSPAHSDILHANLQVMLYYYLDILKYRDTCESSIPSIFDT